MADKPTYEELEQRIKELEQKAAEREQAEKTLRESEKYLKTLLENIQAAVVVHGPDTEIVHCNKEAEELLGMTEGQMLDKKAIDSVWKFLREDGSRIPLEEYPVNQVLNERQPLKDFISCIVRPDKQDLIWALVNANPIFDDNDNVSQVIVTFIDITERKRAEDALRESEEKYRSLFENTGTATFVTEEDMTVSQVNAKCEVLSGYSRDEIVGKMKTTDFIPVEELERIKKYHFERRKKDDDIPPEYDLKLIDKNGNIKNVFIQVGMIPKTKQSIASIIDITPLKQAEKALLFRDNIIRSSSSAIATCDLDGNMTYGNPSFLKAWGFGDPKEFLGRSLWEFWLMEDQLEEIIRLLRVEGTWVDEIQAKRKDGTIFDVQVSAAMVFDSEGNPIALTSTSIDITDRKKVEKALLASEKKYQDLYDNAPDMFVSVDAKTAIIRNCNQTLAEELGYTKEEIIGRPIFDIYTADSAEHAKTNVFQVFVKTGKIKGEELQLQRKNGSTIDVSLNVSASCDEQGNILHSRSVFRDITESKRIEEEREKLINELQEALKEIKTLRGILPLCSHCKKIRDDKGYWEKVDVYIYKYSEADISHSICPDCMKKHYPDLDIYE